MEPIEEVVEQLKELNTTNKRLLEIQGLQFALDPQRYIATKLRSGEAIFDVGSYYQLIGSGATFSATFTNPVGYVWIGIIEMVRVSQQGVIEATNFSDDNIRPFVYIPRVFDVNYSYAQDVPFTRVDKFGGSTVITNHDAAAQWIAVAWLAIWLRKDVWERDIRLMDEAAERYLHPAPLPQYRR